MPDQFPTAGSGMNARTSCAQRQAAAVLAAHSSASSREGTSTTQNPPIASRYGPSLTVPSLATMCFLVFQSGMWSIAWASNEIRYRVIYGSLSTNCRRRV